MSFLNHLEVVSIIEREALQLKNEINSTSPSIIISNVLTTAGEQYYSKEESMKGPGGFTVRSTSTPHIGEVVVILTPADERWNLTGAYDIIDIFQALSALVILQIFLLLVNQLILNFKAIILKI